MNKFVLFITLIFLLTSCTKKNNLTGKIEELQSIQAMKIIPSELELENYCIKKGGHYETWNGEEEFCIIGNYGCEPEKLYSGECGMGI